MGGMRDTDDGFGKSAYEVTVAHHQHFTRVTVTGRPTMEQMLLLVRVIGDTSDTWAQSAVLFDTRNVETEFSRGEQFRLGEEAAASLGHLKKMAALVAPERFTGLTEKGAKRSGANGRVFISREEAMAWLDAG